MLRRLLLLALALSTANGASAKPANETAAVVEATLGHYAGQMKDARRVCVFPEAGAGQFFPVRSGMVRLSEEAHFFRDTQIHEAFKVARQLERGSLKIASSQLPRGFKLSRSRTCWDTLTLLTPAIADGIAFIEVAHRHYDRETSSAETRLLALRRHEGRWQLAETSDIRTYTN